MLFTKEILKGQCQISHKNVGEANALQAIIKETYGKAVSIGRSKGYFYREYANKLSWSRYSLGFSNKYKASDFLIQTQIETYEIF